MTENYNGLTWDIGETPIGSSTPDELLETSYRATTSCPDCGSEIRGIAQYWSRGDGMAGSWLERVDYNSCECADEDDNYDDFEDDEDEESDGVSISKDLLDEFTDVVQTDKKFNLKS